MKSNCVFWALHKKLTVGGYLSFSLAPNYYKVPRVEWSPDNKIWYRFVDRCPIVHPTLIQKLFPLHTLWFKGFPIITRVT